MPRTVNSTGAALTTGYYNAWKKLATQKTIKQIRYKRRYWNGSAYVYESAFRTLYVSDFVSSIGNLSWHLDSVFLNEFRASNVTINLRNNLYEWLEGNLTFGIFRPDAVATSGYDPYQTIFKIDIGYELSDGTNELVTVFTGILTDYILDTQSGIAQLVVTGYEQYLLQSDAQGVNDAFTNETVVEAADGSRTRFTTTSQGVGRVTRVRDNTTTQSEGSGYTISNLNVPGQGAYIDFISAPISGHTIDATGIKWKTNKRIDELVILLLVRAGIASYNVDSVFFPNGVNAAFTVDTEADWEDAGASLTNIDSNSNPGSIKRKWHLLDDFSDNQYTSSPTWNVGNGSWNATSGYLEGDDLGPGLGKSYIYTSGFGKSTGTFRFRVDFSVGSDAGIFFFMNDPGHDGFGNPNGGGYVVTYNRTGDSKVKLEMFDGSYNTLVDMGTVTAGFKDIRITRNSDGNFEAFIDGVSKGTATHTTYTSSAYFSIVGPSSSGYIRIDDIYWTEELDGSGTVSSATAVYITEEFDVGSTPTAWGTLTKIQTLNGGTVLYETAVSNTSGSGYDAYVALGASDQIASALKRYIKVRVTITPSGFNSPQVDKIVANYTTSQPIIALANFTGKTVFAAIQRLAFVCGYEWGFDGDGTFFFRSKSTDSTADFTLNQSNGLNKIKSLRPGWNNVITAGQVSRGDGNYYKEYTPSSLPETSPTSQDRFGERISFQDISDILFANDADVASGMARILHDNGYLPQKEMLAEIVMTPHITPGDILQLSYFEDLVRRDNVFGDPLMTYPAFGQDYGFILRDAKYKAVGLNFDFSQQGEVIDVTLREVLS